MSNRGAPSTFVGLGAGAPVTLRDVLGPHTYATLATPYQLPDSIPSHRAERDFGLKMSGGQFSTLPGGNLLMGTFFETAAPRAADFVLALEIAMGVALLAGARLARKGHFRQHAWCQSVVVLLNLAVVVLMMIPSFRVHVLPRIPVKLGRAYYALATTHAAIGSATELAALYILLSVGTSFLPETFRITKYKAWMRTVLVLWWVVLLLGFATYARWYVPHSFRK